jgi:tetratricopeptide (TPR) repeat protein
MKARYFAVLLFILGLSPAAFGQQAKLEGHVYEIVNAKQRPVVGVRVIAPSGQSKETDSKGHFVIDFPNPILPGQAMRIEVSRPGWVVRDPLFGDCTTINPARNFELLEVIIVPKGSPLALEPKQLSKVIARWADERVKLRAQVTEQKGQLDEYAFLREYAEKYGFTLEQFKDAADRWAKIKESDDKEERALKEYWQRNYAGAARLALESGDAAVEELKRLKNERIVVGRNAIRRYQLAGNSFIAYYEFREALNAYGKIETLFSEGMIAKEDLPEEWAKTKNLLGLAKSELGTRVEGQESKLLLGEAVTAYREALKVFTREQAPQDWAIAQNGLGAALWAQGQRSGGEESVRLLGEAVAAYREVLKVFTREQSPQDWAMTQNNLGVALRSQCERSGGEESVRLLGEAVAAYRESLKVYTRERSPQQWAGTQNNLGVALMRQGERSGGEESVRLLGEAVAAYRESLKVYTRERSPQQWAGTQNNLGAALMGQGERSGGEESVRLLGEAVAAYRESLKVYTREQLPQDWAMTQNNLGNALARQGEQSGGEESVRLLGEAVAAYRESLKVRTHEQLPQDWAMTQNNLGNALMLQGQRAGGEESMRLLGEAVTAFRESLKVRTHEQLPQDWAMTQNNLGAALRSQGERSGGEESVRLLGEAVAAYRESLKVYTREQLPQGWAMTQNNLGNALRSQGEQSGGEKSVRLLGEAVTAFREALKVFTRDQLPQQWATTQNNLGKAYVLLERWEDASVCFEYVLTLYPSYKQGYQSLASIYHERLFEYAKAFKLHQQWLSRFPQDTSVLPEFAETHFTTDRFTEFSQRIKPLLTDPKLLVSAKIALQMIEVANLLALDNANQVPAALVAIDKTISDQKADFRINWSFSGTLNFINRQEKFVSYRLWLDRFFSVAREENRAAIVKALREAQTQFSAMNSGQRK